MYTNYEKNSIKRGRVKRIMNKDYCNEKIINIFSAREEDTNRPYIQKKHAIRGEFERDRDRILYSKAFRRLSGKTQVFLSGKDDHIRNRMTHTIEVTQIARTISKALGINETLTEAIALGHDLGHTPFGHIGERTLNFIMCGCDEIRDFNGCLLNKRGFKHNWQGVRVVHELEKSNNGYGLNLTEYTMWGILHHSNIKNKKCKSISGNLCTLRRSGKTCVGAGSCENLDFYSKYNIFLDAKYLTIEALVVALADEIAQRHHDVEDALETKILEFNELHSKIVECYDNGINKSEDKMKQINEIRDVDDEEIRVGKLSSFIVDLLTFDAITNIYNNLNEFITSKNINDHEEFNRYKKQEGVYDELVKKVNLSDDLLSGDKKFQEYVSKRILNSHKAQSMDGKGNYVIRELFKAYVTNPQQLPDKTIEKLFENIESYSKKDLCDEKYEAQFKELKEIIKELSTDHTVGAKRNILQTLHYTDNIIYKQILMRTICDYIAGMTDIYAMNLHANLYETGRYV